VARASGVLRDQYYAALAIDFLPGSAVGFVRGVRRPPRIMGEEMKQLLIAGTIVLALASSQPMQVQAAPVVFDYTGSLVTFTVPTGGLYQIPSGQGGNLELNPGVITPGGLGAEIGGDFSLIAGEILSVAVGGRGNDGAGAGGGSFVVGPGNVPLVIAGGGGGASVVRGLAPGQGGQTGPNGGNAGGTGGQGWCRWRLG
jgi:hypothetical protein